MALLEANIGSGWFALPTPKPGGYSPTYTHLENSFRDARGYLHRDIIRKNTAKVECSWNALDHNQARTLEQLYNYDYFYLRYIDIFGNRVEKKVYAGPTAPKVERLEYASNIPIVMTDMSMNFIEY